MLAVSPLNWNFTIRWQPSVYFTLNLVSFPCLYINSSKENNCIPSGRVLQKHPDRRRQEQLQEVM